jgi:hypothetical protein
MSVTEDGFAVRHSGRLDLWPAAAGQPSGLPVSAPGAGLEAIASQTQEPVPAQPAAGTQDRMAAALDEAAVQAQEILGPEAASVVADTAAALRAETQAAG